MVAVADIRSGMAANLRTLTELAQVHEHLPGSLTPPSAAIRLVSITYDDTNARGLDAYEFEVLLVVSRKDDERAQQKLDSFLDKTGAHSVKTAIEADSSLGGSVADVHVQEVGSIGQISWAGIAYLGAVITVEVWA